MQATAVEKLRSKPKTTPTSELQGSKNPRYVSKAVQHHIWKRDQGKCTKCGSQRNLNIDHIKAIALGGDSEAENLRRLCFNYNQRQAMKNFGVAHIQRQQTAGQGQLSFSR